MNPFFKRFVMLSALSLTACLTPQLPVKHADEVSQRKEALQGTDVGYVGFSVRFDSQLLRVERASLDLVLLNKETGKKYKLRSHPNQKTGHSGVAAHLFVIPVGTYHVVESYIQMPTTQIDGKEYSHMKGNVSIQKNFPEIVVSSNSFFHASKLVLSLQSVEKAGVLTRAWAHHTEFRRPDSEVWKHLFSVVKGKDARFIRLLSNEQFVVIDNAFDEDAGKRIAPSADTAKLKEMRSVYLSHLSIQVNQKSAQINQCYRKMTPKTSGSLSVNLNIGLDGRLTELSFEGSTLTDAKLKDCVRNEFKALTFPPPPNDDIIETVFTWNF